MDAYAASAGQITTLDAKLLDQWDYLLVFLNEAEVAGRIHRICEFMILAECCARAWRIASTALSHVASRSSTRLGRRATGRVPIRWAIGFVPWLSNHRPFGIDRPEPERGLLPGRSSRPRPAPMALPLRSRRHGSAFMARDRRGGSPACRQPWSGKAMFLNALDCDDAAKSIIKSRAEPSRAEPSRAEPSRAEPSLDSSWPPEPSRAPRGAADPLPSRAEPSRHRASDIVQVLAGRLAPFPPRPAGRSRTLSRQLRTAARLRRCGAKPPVRAAGDTVAAR